MIKAESHNRRLLIVSNRLPVSISGDDGKGWRVSPASGGLVTALAPLMRRHNGVWIGWPGCGPKAPAKDLLEEHSAQHGLELLPVDLTDEDVDKYYRGFSNSAIWPLFHDLLGHCLFDAYHWEAYVRINRRFASVVADQARSGDVIWVHDYQLALTGRFLRERGLKRHLNFFMHIPFPSRDLFRRLPWRREYLAALLDYDHIGFQTANDLRNFVQCVRSLIPEASIVTHRRHSHITLGDRTCRAGAYPISIDFDEFNDHAGSREVDDAAWFLHENLPGRTLVLGLDRLDYTKGIPERFLAFERLLQKYPETHEKVSLVQVAVPSRVNVPDYQDLKERLDGLSGRINSRYSRHGWVPIHYTYCHLDRTQLLGYYRACEIALITPLRDGMNLVSKEYCAANTEDDGVLILSEFAGAASQLGRGAIMVNPYDVNLTADALYYALNMEPSERRKRMRAMRSEVRRNNVAKWVSWFLDAERLEVDVSPAPSADAILVED